MYNVMSTLVPSFLIGLLFFAGSMDNRKILDLFEIRPNPTLWTYNGRNVLTTLVPSFLNESSSFSQLTKTAIKAWMSSILVEFRPDPITNYGVSCR